MSRTFKTLPVDEVEPVMDESVREYCDDSSLLREKIKHLASLIRSATHVVIHTGAGISTSCGIPDYRGPKGVWTLRDRGIKIKRRPSGPIHPSLTHMSIRALVEAGIAHFVVSQNVDGLHVKSGLDPEKLSELHGNSYREYCKRCGKYYYRSYGCRDHKNKVHEHKTGRKCECGHALYDSIVNFGENLPEKDLETAEEECSKSDLCLVIGTSLKVTPASSLPIIPLETGKGKLAIINLQKTEYDAVSSARIFAKADEAMSLLMKELGVEIPPFIEEEDGIRKLATHEKISKRS